MKQTAERPPMLRWRVGFAGPLVVALGLVAWCTSAPPGDAHLAVQGDAPGYQPADAVRRFGE